MCIIVDNSFSVPPISNFHNFKLCLFLKSGEQVFFFFESFLILYSVLMY